MNIDVLAQHITTDPAIQHGRPCIKGTRTSVQAILASLAGGDDITTITRAFAPATVDDVRACILYAALLAGEEEFIPQTQHA